MAQEEREETNRQARLKKELDWIHLSKTANEEFALTSFGEDPAPT